MERRNSSLNTRDFQAPKGEAPVVPQPQPVNNSPEGVAAHWKRLRDEATFGGKQQPFQPNPAEQQAAERLGKPPPAVVFSAELFSSHNQGEPSDIIHQQLATPAGSESPASTSSQDPAELEKLAGSRAYHREYRRPLYHQNPEQARERSHKWRQTEHGKEYYRAYNREYYRRKRNEVAKTQDPVELERIAHRRAYQRDWQRRQYHQNPERARERAREYYRSKQKTEGSSQ
jgi:hypothetical protein